MAACYAAERGASVTIFEKQPKPGRKLSASGNGRCNISNRSLSPEFSDFSGHYMGENPSFVNNVFGKFGLAETEAFFVSAGLPFTEERGRLFPFSLQASSVSAIFMYELKRRGVQLLTERRIDEIRRKGEGFSLTTAGHETFDFDSVILAAGSCAWPSLGGSELGYGLARSLGHRIVPPRPVILPLNIENRVFHRLQGIKWDTDLTVMSAGKTAGRGTGEMLFTAKGISGPSALMISGAVNASLEKKRKTVILADFFPSLTEDQLSAMMDSVWADDRKKFSFSLAGILKDRMCEVFPSIAGISPDARVSAVKIQDRKRFISLLKAMPMDPGQPGDFREAVAATGGVAVDEINPATMESLLVKNLFITGELLDIAGESGGYNLQFAWSTGALAGSSVRTES